MVLGDRRSCRNGCCASIFSSSGFIAKARECCGNAGTGRNCPRPETGTGGGVGTNVPKQGSGTIFRTGCPSRRRSQFLEMTPRLVRFRIDCGNIKVSIFLDRPAIPEPVGGASARKPSPTLSGLRADRQIAAARRQLGWSGALTILGTALWIGPDQRHRLN